MSFADELAYLRFRLLPSFFYDGLHFLIEGIAFFLLAPLDNIIFIWFHFLNGTNTSIPYPFISARRQVANMAQMTNGNLRKTNREMLRNYRNIDGISNTYSPSSPGKRARDNVGGGGGVGGGDANSNGSGSASSGSGSHHHKKVAAMEVLQSTADPPPMPDGGRRCSSSVMETDDDNAVIARPYMEFMIAPHSPVWSKSNATTTANNNNDIDSELLFTYRYPRLYLQDPTHVIGGITSGRYNCDQMKEIWWFHAAQRMETTLKHVHEDHWRALLSAAMTAHPSLTKGNTNQNYSISGYDSTNSLASAMVLNNYHRTLCETVVGAGGVGIASGASPTDGCVAMKELCLGKQHSKILSSRGGDSNPTTAARNPLSLFQPSITPTNVWSEPCASTMNVRGKTYSKDGIKVESETAIFSMLGVDSFVSSDKNDGSAGVSSSGTASYLRRWKGVCDQMGLIRPPFL